MQSGGIVQDMESGRFTSGGGRKTDVYNGVGDSNSDEWPRFDDSYVVLELKDFRFRTPVTFLKAVDPDGFVHLMFGNLDMVACGDGIEDAMDCLNEEVRVAWDHYSSTDDDQLHDDAQRFKRWFFENVERKDA